MRQRPSGLRGLLAVVTILVALVQAWPASAGVGTWTQMDLDNLRVNAVAVDPTDPNIIFAGTNGQGVFRSTDGGRTWSQINSGLGNFFVNDILISPTNPSVVLVATGQGLLVGDPGSGIYRSTNRGDTWSARLVGPFVADIDVSRQNPQVLFAGGAPPVFKSINGGADWVQAFNDVTVFQNVDMRGVAISPSDPNVVLVGAATEGGSGAVFRTANGGDSWSLVQNLGIPFVTSVTFSSNDGQLAFFGNGAGVFRSRDAGVTWAQVLAGPTVRRLLADPTNGNTLYVGTSTQGVFRSVDGGDTFQAINGSLGSMSVFGLDVSLRRPQTLWAGTADGIWSFTFTTPLPPLVLEPVTGPPGTVVRSTGTGFTPGSRVSVLLIQGLGLVVAQPIADATGSIRGSFTMPAPGTVPELTFGPVDVFAIDLATGRETPPAAFNLTAPAAVATWFFAEGSTQPPFDTWYLVENPTGNPANVRFTFQFEGGQTATRTFVVGPHSRFSLFADQLFPDRAMSVRIEADQQVFAERAMYVNFDGHAVTGIPAPNTRWLFAEGSTQPPFHTWLLLQNPNGVPATATITYLVQDGTPRTQSVVLPATSRTSVFVNQVLPDVAFSVQVESDQPIIVERAMYRFPGNAATGVAGVNQASRTWFFAEGNTAAEGLPTDSFLLLQNPNGSNVPVTITLFRETGQPVRLDDVLPPRSRRTFFLNQFVQGSFGIRVEAGDGIIAERSMFSGTEPRGAHATQGSPTLGTVWHLAEGSTAPPFDEVIALMNPGPQAAAVTVQFELEGGQVVRRDLTVPAQSKISVRVDDIIANAANAATITSSLPIVVERTMFIRLLGSVGGHNTIGIRVQ